MLREVQINVCKGNPFLEKYYMPKGLAMNQKQIEFLTKKIVEITNHIERQLDEKSTLVKGYNEEIKSSRKLVRCFAKAVELQDEEQLEPIMEEFERAEFQKIGR